MKLVNTTAAFATYFEDKSVAAPLAAIKETGYLFTISVRRFTVLVLKRIIAATRVSISSGSI